MAPNSVVHIVRHGEGYHQFPVEKPSEHIRDAQLTPVGQHQAVDFCKTFPRHDMIDLLSASPLTRTLNTAQLAFAPVLRRLGQILAIPDAQEVTAMPSDTGSPVAYLQGLFDGQVDFRLCGETWYEKTGDNAPTIPALDARAERVRKLLYDRPEQEIVLVCHGQIAHYLTGNIDLRTGKQLGEWWTNLMWRTYRLEKREGGHALVETQDSLSRHPSQCQ